MQSVFRRTDTKVYICIGSLRQDHYLDEDNEVSNSNGLCFVNYPELVEALKEKYAEFPHTASKLEFYPLTTTDILYKQEEGTHLTKGRRRFVFSKYKNYNDPAYKKDKETIRASNKYWLSKKL